MKNLLSYLALNIADKPDEVEVRQQKTEDGVLHLSLITDPIDTGKLIGKHGVTVNALRNLLKIKAREQNLWFYLEVRARTEEEEKENGEVTETEVRPDEPDGTRKD